MNRKVIFTFIATLLASIFLMNATTEPAYYITEYIDEYRSLDTQMKELVNETTAFVYQKKDPTERAKWEEMGLWTMGRCIENGKKIPQCFIQEAIDHGCYGDYIDAINALGYSVTASGTSTNVSNSAPAPAATPETFTVETYKEPKTMWATQIVNCRSGASTSYGKVGNLKQYEEVKVTGVASTGWFEITKEDGSKIYAEAENFTDDAEHTYVSEVTKETSCAEPGKTTYTCVYCGDTYDEEIPVLPHKEEENWTVDKEPSCTESGLQVKKCSVCGQTVSSEEIPATEHTMGEWEVVNAPTLVKTGLQVKKCTVCGEILEQEEIPINMKTWYIIGGISGAVIIIIIVGAIVIKKKRNKG